MILFVGNLSSRSFLKIKMWVCSEPLIFIDRNKEEGIRKRERFPQPREMTEAAFRMLFLVLKSSRAAQCGASAMLSLRFSQKMER